MMIIWSKKVWPLSFSMPQRKKKDDPMLSDAASLKIFASMKMLMIEGQ
jgi:hypothetical protein